MPKQAKPRIKVEQTTEKAKVAGGTSGILAAVLGFAASAIYGHTPDTVGGWAALILGAAIVGGATYFGTFQTPNHVDVKAMTKLHGNDWERNQHGASGVNWLFIALAVLVFIVAFVYLAKHT